MQTKEDALRDLVDDVLERSDDYEFTVSADNAEECIVESANLFHMDLTQEEINQAVIMLLDAVG
jgi:hypothetical protein